jgi:hypothetical protein
MKYKIDLAMSAILSPQVVEEMIIAAVERQTGRRVTNISVNYDGAKFNGFHVQFDPNQTVEKEIVTTQKFIADRYESTTK